MKWKEILNSLTNISPATLLRNQIKTQTEGKTVKAPEAHKVKSRLPEVQSTVGVAGGGGGGGGAMPVPNGKADSPGGEEGVSHGQRLTPEGATSEKRLYDCAAYVLVCAKHQTMAVAQQTGIHWLPFTVLPTDTSWEEGALLGSFIVLSAGSLELFGWLKENRPYEENYLIDVFRFQWPQTLEFTTRLTYYVKLKVPAAGGGGKFACCQSTGRIQWIPLSVLQSGVLDKVWGPELLEFSRWTASPGAQRIQEISLKQAFCYVPRDPPRNLEEAMLKSASVTEQDVERLYADFVDHCFPAFAMTVWSFKEYMLKYGFENNDQRLVRFFHAFNYQRNGHLSFQELLLGLAVMEPNTAHGEARVKFIFRFYDRKSKGLLFEMDFKKLVQDLFPDLENRKTEFEAKVKESANLFKISEIGGKFGITYDEFFKAINSQRFRGTSALCRAQKPIFAHISRTVKQNMMASKGKQLNNVVSKKLQKGSCARCREKEYILAPYVLRMNHLQQLSVLQPVISTVKRPPENFTKPDHFATKLLKLIRDFSPNKGTVSQPNGLLTNNVPTLMGLFKQVAHTVLALLDTKEGKCVEVSSPAFIIGDIHGNLSDLLSMERVIWRHLPAGANLVFLGDYVDRGKWSFECAVYVLALKALFPHKVTLLRGNHETRELQIKYSFQLECTTKFDDDDGIAIWSLLNQVFDRLPVVAILDDAIYCAHGGIPKSAPTLAEIANQPLDISSPDQDNPVVWETVWSDPLHPSQFLQLCEYTGEESSHKEGFAMNIKRGAAWFFNDEAVNRFFATNGLTHMVRAHEVPANGFTFHFDKKCATIFCCSHYCGQSNKCGCLFVDQETIRVVLIDTENNLPATESKQ